MIAFFLTSGLFLGWSLGANDAANVFGTAVGTKMIRFRTAAIIASIFVIIGAVFGGAGATHTLGKLGAVNAIAGSFVVAFGAAITVFFMTHLKLPVSTSQAIVGAIIGWNIFSGSLTDYSTLTKIVLTWVLCPALSAGVAVLLYYLFRYIVSKIKINLLREDIFLRWGLLFVGAFGSYSLGANNIANVMGVFVPAIPLQPLNLFGVMTLSGTQQLFFIGAVAISIGIISYSGKVMETVGSGLLRLSPITALIVVLSQAIVLFLFSSEQLESWLILNHLPSLPLVPVSSSQAVVGAVIGIGLIKGGKEIKFNILGRISSGWITTPIIAGIITLISLFFLQNVFNQEVSTKQQYIISDKVLEHLQSNNITIEELGRIEGLEFPNSKELLEELKGKTTLPKKDMIKIVNASQRIDIIISPEKIKNDLDKKWFSKSQIEAIESLVGNHYEYSWNLIEDLISLSEDWKLMTPETSNKLRNKKIRSQYEYLIRTFKK